MRRIAPPTAGDGVVAAFPRGAGPFLPQDPLPFSSAPPEALADLADQVSVIVPTRDRRDLVVTAIDSILDQTVLPGEIVVVDDGSRDGTVDVLRSRFQGELASGLLHIVKLAGEGQGAARNWGLDQARGDLIAYLDSDNRWHPQHLQCLLAFGVFEGHDFVYSGVQVSDVTVGKISALATPFSRAELLRANFIDTSSILHRRYLCEQWGGWDNRFSRLIDWEFVLRLTSERDAALVPVLTVEMIIGHDSVTSVADLQPDVDIIDAQYPLERCLVGAADFSYRAFVETIRCAGKPEWRQVASGVTVGSDFATLRGIDGWSDRTGFRATGERDGVLLICASLEVPQIAADALAAAEALMAENYVTIVHLDPPPFVVRRSFEAAEASIIELGAADSDRRRLVALRRVSANVAAAYVVGRSDWAVEHCAEIRTLLAAVPMVHEVRDCEGSWMFDFSGNGASLSDVIAVHDEHDAHKVAALNNVGTGRVEILSGTFSASDAVRIATDRVRGQEVSAIHHERGERL